MFTPFSVNPSNGVLTKVPDNQRLDAFQSHQFRRCPGGSVLPPPDGSAPVSVPGCNPSSNPDSN
jgi:hypothetical protein